jgi:hypothetical protein
MHQRAPEINSLCCGAILFLSCVALLAVLSGYTQPPQTDEGTGAHVFQLSIVLLAPAILLFLATADWSRPLRTIRPLAFSAMALVLALERRITSSTTAIRTMGHMGEQLPPDRTGELERSLAGLPVSSVRKKALA